MTKDSTKTSDLLSTSKKRSLWSYLFVFFLIGVVGLSVFVGSKQKSLSTEKTKLKNILVNLDEEIAKQEKKDGYDRQQALVSGQDILERAQKYRVRWSQIYSDITFIENDLAVFYDINATRDKKFNINGITSSLENVSKLLILLKSNPKFVDSFISQISEVRNADKKAYNFTLSFEYIYNQTPKK